MAKESLEVIENGENHLSLEYKRPKFYKKVLAIFFDLIFLFLAFIGSYIGVGYIVKATPTYRTADQQVIDFRKSMPEMYHYSSSRDTYENIVTWLENNNDTSYSFRVESCSRALDEYFNYILNNSGVSNYDEAYLDYVNCATSPNMVDDNKISLFVVEVIDKKQTVKKNPNCSAGSDVYYNKFYKEYCLENCEGFLIAFFPNYRNGLKTMSNLLFFVQFPISAVLAGILIYFVPPLIFRRGRRTFGRQIMQIGIVDKNVLNVSFPRFLAKFSIHFFAEILLSFFTFGIPLIISLSMMCFSKNKQRFCDYLLNINEVDLNSNKIYFNKYEILVDKSKDHKEAINFKPKKDI